MYKYLMVLMVVVTIVGLVITKGIAERVREDTVLEKHKPIATYHQTKAVKGQKGFFVY